MSDLGSSIKCKKLGLPSAISICVGLIVASGCLLSLGRGVGLSGSGFIVSMFIVVILNIFLALSFNELYSLMPHVNGGLGQYTKAALGNVLSIVSNISAYLIVNLLAISVELSICGISINSTFLPQVPAPVISIAFLIILTIVNYRGIDLFSRIQNIVVSLLIISLIIMGFISYFKLGTNAPVIEASKQIPQINSFGGYISLSAMAFWLFIGIEFVIPVAKDLKNPKRDVLLSMILGVCLLFIVQSILGKGMLNYVSVEELSTSEMPHIIFARNLLGKTGEQWMAIVTILAAISTTNTVFGSIPRILAGMSENNLFPKIFSKTNKYGISTAGLLIMPIGNTIFILTGFSTSSGLSTLLLAASCFWLTSYILVNFAVLVLRKKMPDNPNRNKKLTLHGLPQIISIIGEVYMILNIAEGNEKIFIFKLYGIILLFILSFACIWVKYIMKMPLFGTMTLSEIDLMQ